MTVAEAAVITRPLSPTQAATRRKLLDAARDLAAADGYEGVTVRTVAAAAGVSAPTAYQYFSSKDHLLVDVLVELVGTTAVSLADRPVAGATLADRASATLRRAVANVARAPELYVALTRAYLTGGPAVAHARDAMEGSTRRWTELALAGTEVDPDLQDVLESLLFAHMVGLVTGRRTPATLADDLERAVRTVMEARP
ncbi:MAG TPA: TetR family transcriptional regulator [Acidimicrobiales bacterium]